MAKPPDFSADTIRTLAKRASQVCSKPDCRQPTSGPHTDPAKAINLGRAAHIKGARRGPNNRFDLNMTDEQRADISNGIWLCTLHADEIDTDESKFPVQLLVAWKEEHEQTVMTRRGDPHPLREVRVKGGIGGLNVSSGGTALEIINDSDRPSELIIVEGGIGDMNISTNNGTAKRIISVQGGRIRRVID